MLTPGSHITASTSELALLIAMVAVFVAGLIAVSGQQVGRGPAPAWRQERASGPAAAPPYLNKSDLPLA